MKSAKIMTGIDGKISININRQITTVGETVRLLPFLLQIIERFRKDPYYLSRNKLLPVPTNQEYNRCLKVIATAIVVMYIFIHLIVNLFTY
jgi:hypothetical protein